MLGNVVRRWVVGTDDVVGWAVGKLPRASWPLVEEHDDHCLVIGPGGLFSLHPVASVPQSPDDAVRRIHAAARAASDRLLSITSDRVWPLSVGVLPVDSLQSEKAAFGVHFVSGDHLLRWLLTRPEALDDITRSNWARCMAEALGDTESPSV
ncbi:MAG: hypothetical protein WAN48_09960 [Actinomycetes bacterium]